MLYETIESIYKIKTFTLRSSDLLILPRALTMRERCYGDAFALLIFQPSMCGGLLLVVAWLTDAQSTMIFFLRGKYQSVSFLLTRSPDLFPRIFVNKSLYFRIRSVTRIHWCTAVVREVIPVVI